MLEVSAATSETLDLDELLQNVSNIVSRVLHYELFAILLYNDREKDLRYDSGRGQAFIKLWDVKSGVEVFTLRYPTAEAPSLGFSPEGNLLTVATGSDVRVWDARPIQAPATPANTNP